MNKFIVLASLVFVTGCMSPGSYTYSQTDEGVHINADGYAAVEAARATSTSSRANYQSTPRVKHIYERPISYRRSTNVGGNAFEKYLDGISQRAHREIREHSPARKIQRKLDELEYRAYRCGLDPRDC